MDLIAGWLPLARVFVMLNVCTPHHTTPQDDCEAASAAMGLSDTTVDTLSRSTQVGDWLAMFYMFVGNVCWVHTNVCMYVCVCVCVGRMR